MPHSHGYWGDKLMHRAGFDLAINHMRRPHLIVELVPHLNQCATLPPICRPKIESTGPKVFKTIHGDFQVSIFDKGDDKTLRGPCKVKSKVNYHNQEAPL